MCKAMLVLLFCAIFCPNFKVFSRKIRNHSQCSATQRVSLSLPPSHAALRDGGVAFSEPNKVRIISGDRVYTLAGKIAQGDAVGDNDDAEFDFDGNDTVTITFGAASGFNLDSGTNYEVGLAATWKVVPDLQASPMNKISFSAALQGPQDEQALLRQFVLVTDHRTDRAPEFVVDAIVDAGSDVVSLDWRVDLREAAERFGSRVSLQGNLDPCALSAPRERIFEMVRELAQAASKARGHVLNLGHGCLPGTPVEGVKAFTDAARELAPR